MHDHLIALQDARNHRRRDGGEDDETKGFGREFDENNLKSEDGTRERRMECGRDASRRAARGQQDHAGDGHMQPRGNGGTQRRSDLNDRALAASGSARADSQCRRNDLHDRNAPRDAPTLTTHSEHHLGDAVALRRRGEALDQRSVQETSDSGGEEEKEPRCPPPDAVRLTDVGRVLVETCRHPGPCADRKVKQDGCCADDAANECSGDAEQGTMRGDRLADA